MASEERKEAFLRAWFDAPEGVHWAHGMSNEIEQNVSDCFDKAIAAWTTPVAPVSPDATGKCGELVTVAWVWNNANGTPLDISFSPNNADVWRGLGHAVTEWVARSQAEELLAAKDADIDRVLADNRRCLVRIAELEADNAALTARVNFLERTWKKAERRADALEAKFAAAEKSKVAMRKAAVDYCWQRYKGREPMNLKDPAVFTSHEWEKIGEVMDEAARAALGGKP